MKFNSIEITCDPLMRVLLPIVKNIGRSKTFHGDFLGASGGFLQNSHRKVTRYVWFISTVCNLLHTVFISNNMPAFLFTYFFNSSQGCHWILVKHDKVTTEDEPWEKIVNRKIREGILTLKFEPFILHVQCRGEIRC